MGTPEWPLSAAVTCIAGHCCKIEMERLQHPEACMVPIVALHNGIEFLPDLRRVEMPPPGDLRELSYVLTLVSFLIRVTNDLTKVTSGRKDSLWAQSIMRLCEGMSLRLLVTWYSQSGRGMDAGTQLALSL